MDVKTRISLGCKKNNQISDVMRTKGNKAFAKADYFEALSMFNAALCFAEPKSEQLAFAYGNRSAAFLEVKQYQACLQNIQLARDNNYPSDKLSKLIQREVKCKEMMASHEGPIEETWNDLFKLTYEPNPKVPFLADCIELKKHEHGMMLATKRNLKPGDIIAITEPFYRYPMDTSYYRCNYCLSNEFMNFIPCSGCSDAMFCNEKCLKEAMNEFHQFECGTNENLGDFIKSALTLAVKCLSLFDYSRHDMEQFLADKKKLHTPFDYDLSDPTSLSTQKNLMRILLSDQLSHSFNIEAAAVFATLQPFIRRHPKLKDLISLEWFQKVIDVVCGDVKSNRSLDGKKLTKEGEDFGLPQGMTKLPGMPFKNTFGLAADVCRSFFLFSCTPNLLLHHYNDKIVWIVLLPIKAGNWFELPYQNTFFYDHTIESRRNILQSREHVGQSCKCVACVNNWGIVQAVAVVPLNIMNYSSKEAVEEYKDCCEEIKKCYKPLRKKCNDDLWLTISHFRWNLYAIGKASFWSTLPKPDYFKIPGFAEELQRLGLQPAEDWQNN